MARYLVQSAVTFEFLHFSERMGSVTWTPSLAAALATGVCSDEDQVQQLIQDHCDSGRAVVVDLDEAR